MSGLTLEKLGWKEDVKSTGLTPEKLGVSLDKTRPYAPKVKEQQPKEVGPLDAAGRGFIHGGMGVGESLATGMEYLGGKTGSENLMAGGKDVGDYLREKAKPFEAPAEIQGNILSNPGLMAKGSWWTYHLADMLPSFGAMMIPSAAAGKAISALGKGGKTIQVAGKALTLTPKVVERLAKIGSMTVAGVTGGGMEGSSTYQEILKRGGTREDAESGLEAMTLAAGALNSIGFGKLTGKLGAKKSGALMRFLKGGSWEGFTEYMEEPAEVLIKRGILPEAAFNKEEAVEQLRSGVNVIPIAGVMGGGTSVAFSGQRSEGKQKVIDDALGEDGGLSAEEILTGESESKALLGRFRREPMEDLASLRQSPGGAEYAKELDQVIGEKGIAEERGLIPRKEMGPRALPPGQGFGLVTEEEAQARRGIPYSPELAEGLQKPKALPPGQGFDLLPPKPKTRLKKAPPTYPEDVEYVAGKEAPEGLEVDYKPVLTKKEKPWKNKENAFRAMESKRLASRGITPETHEVVPVEDGFGITKKVVKPTIKKPAESKLDLDTRRLTDSSGKDIDIKVGMHVKVNDSTTGIIEGFEAGVVLFRTDPINEAERAGKARPIQKINDSNVFDVIEKPSVVKETKLKKISEKVKAETPGMLKESDKVNDVTLGTLVKHATEDPAKALEHAAEATVSKAKLIEGLKNKGLKAMGEAKSKEERAEIKRNLEETLRGIEEGETVSKPKIAEPITALLSSKKKAGINYEMQVKVEETGETVTVTKDAAVALRETKEELSKWEKFLACLA